MIVVTSGKRYVDIDGYASMTAYRELLKSLGEDAYAVSSAELNSSVPPLIKELHYQLDRTVPDNPKYILVDISNPDFIDDNIQESDIIEVIDHHVGFEEYWRGRGVKTEIEFIGSVCTLIYEKIVENDKQDILDTDLCKLLTAGILDNTINLRASITTKRDIDAYDNLKTIGKIPNTWAKAYFDACDEVKAKDYRNAILSDMKVEKTDTGLPEAIGQIILESPDKIDYETIRSVFSDYERWMINIISLSDGKSYIYFGDAETKKYLENLFGVDGKDSHLIVLDDFLLRKQILKLARDA